MKPNKGFVGGVLSLGVFTVALAGAFASTSPAQAAVRQWFCQSVCVGVDSGAKRVMLLGPVWANARTRPAAFIDLIASCRALAAHEGLIEAIPAKHVAYNALEQHSLSERWEIQANAKDATHRGSFYSSGFYGTSWNYETARAFRSAGSRSFSSQSEFQISLDYASMTDASVCSQEVMDDSWVPPFTGYPDEPVPLG